MRKILLGILAILVACPLLAQSRFVGGDISLLSSYVSNGAEYYQHDGTAITDPLSFFKDEGMNAMRVRLFVDPSNASSDDKGEGVCQDLDYEKALGKQIKDAGLKFMLDFHYSDSWADPEKQFTPKDWLSLNDTELATQLYSYTKDVLEQLIAYGAEPDFIQTGNEISYGMLWGEEGSTSLKQCYPSSTANWSRFTNLLTQAVKACREACPSAGIILHVERVSSDTSIQADNANYAALGYFLSTMASASIDYDIIGLSYYPHFHGNLSQLDGALTYVETNYPDKPIMIVETGYSYQWEVNGATYDYTDTYPLSDEGQANFTTDLITLLLKHENVNGLFWWWMEANEKGLDWETERVTDSWNNASLFDNSTGCATSALSLLQTFLEIDTGITSTEADKTTDDNGPWYTLDGKKLPGKPSSKGFYIHGGKIVSISH